MHLIAAKNSYLELIIKRNHIHLLTTRLKDELVKSFMTVANNTKKEKIEFILEYHVSAVFGILGYWIRNDRNIPEQVLLERVYSISKEGIFTTMLKQIDGDRNIL